MSRRTRRHTAPLVFTAVGAAGALLMCAPPASAHVRVIGDVIPGQPATLQFRVPSELKTATTVRISVHVPSAVAVTSVPPVDGWTIKRAPEPGGKGTRLVWTAKAGHEIKPAASKVFPVQVGAIPDQRSLEFETNQTYSNGTIAAWEQEQTGAKEPKFPVPELVIDPSAPTSAPDAPDTSRSASAAAGPTVAAGPAKGTRDASSDDSGSRWAWAGGGVAGAAVVAGGGLLLRRNRRER